MLRNLIKELIPVQNNRIRVRVYELFRTGHEPTVGYAIVAIDEKEHWVNIHSHELDEIIGVLIEAKRAGTARRLDNFGLANTFKLPGMVSCEPPSLPHRVEGEPIIVAGWVMENVITAHDRHFVRITKAEEVLWFQEPKNISTPD